MKFVFMKMECGYYINVSMSEPSVSKKQMSNTERRFPQKMEVIMGLKKYGKIV